jgi:hypothetical protein
MQESHLARNFCRVDYPLRHICPRTATHNTTSIFKGSNKFGCNKHRPQPPAHPDSPTANHPASETDRSNALSPEIPSPDARGLPKIHGRNTRIGAKGEFPRMVTIPIIAEQPLSTSSRSISPSQTRTTPSLPLHSTHGCRCGCRPACPQNLHWWPRWPVSTKQSCST